MQTVTSPHPDPGPPNGIIRADPIPIQWDESLPIFAKEEFLRAVGDEYGWLGGIDAAGALRCILPYTIVRKGGLRLVRFRVETILKEPVLDVASERSFLNSVVDHFRKVRADVIIPATNNAIFRTYPDGAQAAPYGTYKVDLREPEDVLWKGLNRILRQNINTAKKDGITIREASDLMDPAYDLIRETFGRSDIDFMSRLAFRRFVEGLGRHGVLLTAEHHGVPQSYCVLAFSTRCAYAIYAGNRAGLHQGANKLLYWEAMCRFKGLGVEGFDFVGARINPAAGSKQESINALKRRFGARLLEGYMWKVVLRPWRGAVYSLGVRLLNGGDIVDQEKHKLQGGLAKEAIGGPSPDCSGRVQRS